MQIREALNWLGTGCFLLGTISMVSTHAASVAYTPWLLYMIGNVIWLIDSIRQKQIPWATIAAFFVIWDTLIIASRVIGMQVFDALRPLINILETLP